MAVLHAEELYERYIKRLPISEQLRLVTMTTDAISRETAEPVRQERSLLELEGLGAHLWEGIEAQEYVKQLRNEWEDRP